MFVLLCIIYIANIVTVVARDGKLNNAATITVTFEGMYYSHSYLGN